MQNSRACFVVTFVLTVAFSAPLRAQSPLWTFDGSAQDQQFGRAVAGAGDVNNDGYDDILVGAYLDNASRGLVRVFSGKTGAILYTLTGAAAGDEFGRSIAGVGDVNADGHDDFIVGSWYADANGSNAGLAKVFSGKTGAVLYTYNGPAAFDHLGTCVAGVGDVNGDGRPDFAIGIDNLKQTASGPRVGAARVYSGANGAQLYTFFGTFTGGAFGTAVGGAGDVNGDGRADIIVGAPLDGTVAPNQGVAKVYSGANGALLFTLNGAAAGDFFGATVGSAGDLNGDGKADLLVGAPLADPNGVSAAGVVRTFSGANGSALWTVGGDAVGDNLGGDSASGPVGATSIGDIDGDGRPDIVAGMRNSDLAGTNTGAVRLLSGATGATLTTIPGVSGGELFGHAVGALGDVNADGIPDFAAGAIWADPQGTSSGQVRVFSGAEGCSGFIEAYGSSCPGSGGFLPMLKFTGCPKVGNSISYTISQGLGGATAMFITGDHRVNNAFPNGCLLLVAPQRRLVTTTLLGAGPGNGTKTITLPIPPASLGTTVEFQGYIFDSGAPGGFVTTNAIEIQILQ